MQTATIITLISAAGLTYSLTKEEKPLNILNGLILLGSVFVLIGTKELKMAGMLAFLFTIGFTSIYLIRRSDLEKKQRFLGSFAGIIFLSAVVPGIMHWPGAGLMSLISGIPVLLGIVWLLSKSKKDPKFLSPLIVFVPLCLVRFVWLIQNII